MRIVPISLPDASAFIDMIHRHNKRPSIAATIAAGLEHEGKLIGVVMAGRPVARALDDGLTLEVHRVATVEDAPRGSVSCLYQAMRRAAGALGYRKCITYTPINRVRSQHARCRMDPGIFFESPRRMGLPFAAPSPDPSRWHRQGALVGLSWGI